MKTFHTEKGSQSPQALANWTGISNVALSFIFLLGSLGIWLMGVGVVLLVGLLTCGILWYGGGIIWYGIICCSALQSLLNIAGLLTGIVGAVSAFRSDYRWIMLLKGVGCLIGNGGLLTLGGWAGWTTYRQMIDWGWDVWNPFAL